MQKKITLSLALIGFLALSGPAFAELCTIDDVPAATLLLPYFEVDLDNPDGITTLFSINNASASAALAHVVFWTDLSIPTLDFDVYLTGFDVQTINVRDIFLGNLPITADDARDPADTISPQGSLSQDITFPGCGGFPFVNPELNAAQRQHVVAAHTGDVSGIFGACAGLDYGDGIARGYITIDSVSECSLLFPNNAGYFGPGGTGIANNRNILWGNYHYLDPENNFAQGETLVHIEASAGLALDAAINPSGETFYGRFVAAGEDEREPLGTTYAARFINGLAFDGGTDLIVWRDSKDGRVGPGEAAGPFASCDPFDLPWFQLNQTQVVAFDEEENPAEICIPGEDNVSPPTGQAQTCFPAEAQRVPTQGPTPVPFADDMNVPWEFGWLYLNLNHSTVTDPTSPAQAWVTTVFQALGRFSTGMDAIQLDSACTTLDSTGVILGE